MIHGLGWRHPAVALNALSFVLFAIYFAAALLLPDMPSGRFSYPLSMLGAAFSCWLAVRCVAETDLTSERIGFALSAMNIIASIGACLVVLAEGLGPTSILWRILNQ